MKQNVLERVSVDAIEFLNFIIRLNPKDRPFLEDVLAHKYLTADLSKVKKLSEIAKVSKIEPGKYPCISEKSPDFLVLSTRKDNFS